MSEAACHVVTVEQNGKQVEKITYDSDLVVVIGKEQSSVIAHKPRLTDFIEIILRIDHLRNILIERLVKETHLPKDTLLKMLSEFGDTVGALMFEKKL